ncbi:hypothetical protein [Azospirillum soli]|uniref:hypothetical protein n=1 Tax=Azospirillum soli TaxID=1304799 RepID=UPI001AEA9C99|nr:hypothetical protein [Azospirillum soli]MBP2316139.1 hypothetical protein [Azospirillum soli]
MTQYEERYRLSLEAYDDAKKKAMALVADIANVSSSSQYNLTEFLCANYGLVHGARRTYEIQKHRFKMDEWPDAETVRSTFQGLSDSFMEAHRAWSAIPETDRRHLREPPKEP